MTREQVIRRMCSLADTVRQTQFDNEIAADCVCDWSEDTTNPKTFQFNQLIMEYIEVAVDEKLLREMHTCEVRP